MIKQIGTANWLMDKRKSRKLSQAKFAVVVGINQHLITVSFRILKNDVLNLC
ncbi:MAG: hypothetical protein ACRC2T_11190 [Thermoguttaceae bacterium]